MSQAHESARQEASGFRTYLLTAYYLLTEKLSLTATFFGVLLVLLGVTFAPSSKTVSGIPLPTGGTINGVLGGLWPTHGLLSAMVVTWGATIALFGLVVYGVLWGNRLYGQFVRS